MKNRVKLFGVIAIAAITGVSMTGCATNVAGVPPFWGWDREQIPIFAIAGHVYTRDLSVLGVVQVEGTTTRILRLGIPFTRFELALFSFSDAQVTYANLLAEAQRQFPRSNAVTSVQIDRIDSNILFFFSTRRYIATGLAVEIAEEARR